MLNLIPRLSSYALPRSFRELQTDQRGVTALEYGLLAGLIAVALIGVLTTFGHKVEGLFTSVSSDVAGVRPTTSGTGG